MLIGFSSEFDGFAALLVVILMMQVCFNKILMITDHISFVFCWVFLRNMGMDCRMLQEPLSIIFLHPISEDYSN